VAGFHHSFKYYIIIYENIQHFFNKNRCIYIYTDDEWGFSHSSEQKPQAGNIQKQIEKIKFTFF
jgi:hypothetical protein